MDDTVDLPIRSPVNEMIASYMAGLPIFRGNPAQDRYRTLDRNTFLLTTHFAQGLRRMRCLATPDPLPEETGERDIPFPPRLRLPDTLFRERVIDSHDLIHGICYDITRRGYFVLCALFSPRYFADVLADSFPDGAERINEYATRGDPMRCRIDTFVGSVPFAIDHTQAEYLRVLSSEALGHQPELHTPVMPGLVRVESPLLVFDNLWILERDALIPASRYEELLEWGDRSARLPRPELDLRIGQNPDRARPRGRIGETLLSMKNRVRRTP